MDYIKFERISIKNHPFLNERWVQDKITDDLAAHKPGVIVFKKKERISPEQADCIFYYRKET